MKVLVIGYGSIGKRHIDNLSSLVNVEIIICTHKKLDNFLRKRKCKVIRSLEKCIQENPEFAIIANESSLHLQTAIKLAKSGINLLIEKPLSDNLRGVKVLLNLVKKRMLITLMGCNLRFHPCIKKIKEILQNQEIGRVISVLVENGSYLPDWHPGENYRYSYAARKEMGGGVVLTSIHEIDYLYWFFGKVKEVFSITGKYSDLDLNVEDLSAILLKFTNKVIGEVHLDYFQKPAFRGCKVIGTKGTIYWNSNLNTVKVFDVKKKRWITKMKLHKYDNNSMYVDELNYFLKCIKKNSKTMNTVFDGSNTLKIGLSLKKATKSKKMVNLN